jgi:hypothetical protein
MPFRKQADESTQSSRLLVEMIDQHDVVRGVVNF